MSKYYIGDLEFYSDPREELEHHGIIGQKWGIRRFQNADGSYTAEGLQRRYGAGVGVKNGVPRMKSAVGEKLKEKLRSTFKPTAEERAERKANRAAKAAERAKEKEIKTAVKAEERRQKAEAERARVVKEGSVEEVLRMSHDLSPSDLQTAVNRLRNEDALRQMIANEKNRNAREPRSLLDCLQGAEKLINSYVNIKSNLSKLSKEKEEEAEKARDDKVHEKERAYARRMVQRLNEEAVRQNKNRDLDKEAPWFPSFDDVTKINQQINAFHVLQDAAEGKFSGGGGKKKK